MSDEALPCVRCDVRLSNVMGDCDNQPIDGTAFTSGGHYGSTFFDPMDGQQIEINICDPCLVVLRDKQAIAWRQAYRDIKCAGVYVGREQLVRPLVPFTEQDEQHLEMDVDPSDLGKPWPNVMWFAGQFEFARGVYESEPDQPAAAAAPPPKEDDHG